MTFISLVPPIYFDVEMYGAVADGATDSTTMIANARSAANAAGGGIVMYRQGVYISGPQTIYNNVIEQGAGIKATTIRLKAGSNDHLFKGSVNGYGGGVMVNIAAANGTGSSGGNTGFGFRDLTLDGNAANQSSGPSWVIQVYGCDYIIQNVYIYNGYSGGLYSDWNGGTTSNLGNMEAQISNVKVFSNRGTGIKFAGPNDSQFINVYCFRAYGNGFHFGPNTFVVCTNCHAYSTNNNGDVNACAFLVECADCSFFNCQAEGANSTGDMQVALLGNGNYWNGRVFNSGGASGGGLQVGQAASLTPFYESVNQSGGVTTAVVATDNNIQGYLERCIGTNGALYFANSGGRNLARAVVEQTSGLYFGGTISSQDKVEILGHGLGQTTFATSGGMQWGATSPTAFQLRDYSGNAIFNINSLPPSRRFELSNGTILRQYSDGFTTRTVELSNGTISLFESTTAAAIATNGTITSSGVGVARVAPTGNVTGIILQAGTLAGQQVKVRNESAFTVTFDVSGTSHVADGATSSIPANCTRVFEWSSYTSLWYRSA